jgi:hypothetical protein
MYNDKYLENPKLRLFEFLLGKKPNQKYLFVVPLYDRLTLGIQTAKA